MHFTIEAGLACTLFKTGWNARSLTRLDAHIIILSSCDSDVLPIQTKILEDRTNLSECVFEALFEVVSTPFGLRIVEKRFEDTF
jgi:hypothetical protein